VRGRNQTVSQRSEPNSRNALEHEQCYPSQLLHQEDALIRHRGSKPTRQYELSSRITLLWSAYLVSSTRHSVHTVMPDHYKHGKLYYHPARAITLTVQLPLLLLYSKLQNDEVEETYIPPLLFRRFPPQANYQI